MSDEMDLPGGWTLRVTAVDPTSGNVMPAIVVADLAMEVATVGATVPTDLAFGPFMLVPGPGA